MKTIMPILLVAVLFAVSVVPAFAGPKGDTIVDVAIAVNSEGDYAGMFDTLIAAVLAADPAVLATLTGNGQHTVFAPTDDAFEAIGLTPDNIGNPDIIPQDVLTAVLLYHVAPGRRYSGDVLESDRIRTLLKGKDGFVMQDGGVLNGYATIIVTDVPAANGIIHAIDGVLLP
jgi:uncharacterized surface protein with fasciclin (FAS1) repeats